jgi:S-formylglutathione hydrolase FrmB
LPDIKASLLGRREHARMRTHLVRLLALAVLPFLASCGGGGTAGLDYECFTTPSAAIGQSLVGNAAQGRICALLPPSYATSPDRRYAVVYFLHGFDESPEQLQGWRGPAAQAMSGGDEAIVVALQGGNQLRGGFYVDSDVTGRFETWVTQEAIAAVDARYRTIAAPSSRGLAGFSMGGFGALNLGLRHPDVFQAAFAYSGGFLAPGGLSSAMSSWAGDRTFLQAYGATFASDTSAAYPYARIPAMTQTAADLAVQDLWYAGFGDWGAKLDVYMARPDKLAAIRIEWARGDNYAWIRDGSAWLVQEMTANRGLTVESETHPGNHVLPMGVVRDCLLPFFFANLALEG